MDYQSRILKNVVPRILIFLTNFCLIDRHQKKEDIMKKLDPRSVLIGFLVAVIGFMAIGATDSTFDTITVLFSISPI